LREREKRKFGRGVVRNSTVLGRGGIETKFAVLKIPRQCPLVFLVEVGLV
jgi:hypothetical protein